MKPLALLKLKNIEQASEALKQYYKQFAITNGIEGARVFDGCAWHKLSTDKE